MSCPLNETFLNWLDTSRFKKKLIYFLWKRRLKPRGKSLYLHMLYRFFENLAVIVSSKQKIHLFCLQTGLSSGTLNDIGHIRNVIFSKRFSYRICKISLQKCTLMYFNASYLRVVLNANQTPKRKHPWTHIWHHQDKSRTSVTAIKSVPNTWIVFGKRTKPSAGSAKVMRIWLLLSPLEGVIWKENTHMWFDNLR